MDYLKRARLRVRAVEALMDAEDFADAVRESQESVELAVKALLKLKGLSYPRAHDVARLLRDGAVTGTAPRSRRGRPDRTRVENTAT
jgi:HEPN domain-containing protein